MSRGLYFYDQYTRVSHLGGIQRYKRHHDELNQALHQHRIAIAADSDQTGNAHPVTPAVTVGQTPSPNKQQLQFAKQTNEHLLKAIQRKFQSSFVPDLLFKELDRFFQRYDEDESGAVSSEATPKVLSSNVKKSNTGVDQGKDDDDENIAVVDEVDDDRDLINRAVNRPKLSLPAWLILRLHSSWADLIEDTRYRFPVWRTKGGEEEWNRLVERRRLERANAEKQRAPSTNKQATTTHRAGSRGSITSIKNLYVRRQTTTTMASQLRSNRSVSRVSFATAADQTRQAKIASAVPPTSSESFTDQNKNAVHMEFKFSTQIDPIKQQQQQAINQPKGITVDVKKSIVSTTGDEILLLQNRCKMLLADMKEKIDLLEKNLSTDSLNLKLTKLWFYGDNQQVRNRTNLLTYNETAKRQRSKFIFSIVRGEIPEKYQIEIEIPHTKKKCLLEFDDGTTQIYYPSGRLAILRLPSKKSEILFFDDKESMTPEFLGFVMSDLGTVLMEPSSYPRLISADRFEHFYLCSIRKGEIEKEILWNRNSLGRESILSNRDEHQSVDDDDILPPLFENTIQFQINRTIQLEFSQPKNIRFGFACEQEEFQFQLIPYKAATPTNNVSPTNNLMKKLPSKSKQSSQSNSVNEISMKQQIQIERLLDGQINQKDLPMFKELLALRKRIRMICSHWLKACRSTLGVMDIDSYCLPDLPSARTAPLVSSIEKSSRLTHLNRSKSAKPPRHVTISPKNPVLNREFLQPAEKEIILRTLSAKKPPADLLERSLTQFTAHSDTARTIQKNYERKRFHSPVHLPAINDGRRSVRDDLTGNRSSMEMDFPYACPTLIRQRLIKDNRLSIVSDTCSCRVDRLPLIHDLEFDLFIHKSNHFNPKQLILVGIINSNLHDLDSANDDNDEESDARQSKELCETLEKFHNERNFGRSPMCLCRLLTQDDYRCLVYDLAQATKQSSIPGPLLVRRHHVQPGFLLIYQHGHLIFGDSIFNGYGRNIYDLQKQLQNIKPSQTPLPDEFKFISDHRQSNKTILKSV